MKRFPKPSISLGAGVLALALCLLTGCANVEPKVVADFPDRDAPNYQSLVSVSWLKGLLDYQQSGFQTPRPATYRNERFVILEASWATLEKAQDYRNGHLPGAIHFNTDELENGSPRWRLRDAEELQRAIGRAGITPDTTVIIYGGKLIAAARVWWALKWFSIVEAAGDRVSPFSMPCCWDSRTSETIQMAGAVGARSITPIRRRWPPRPAGGNNSPAIR